MSKEDINELKNIAKETVDINGVAFTHQDQLEKI